MTWPDEQSVRSESPCVRLCIVRHAHALDRYSYDNVDSQRPLSEKGERQALALAKTLAAEHPLRLLASPAVRCKSTLGPLAHLTGLSLGSASFLAEGSPGMSAFYQLIAIATSTKSDPPIDTGLAVIACSHGDVIDSILAGLIRTGVDVLGMAYMTKCEAIILTICGDNVAAVKRITPPTD